LSRCDHQISSFDAGSTRQFSLALASPTWVRERSSNRVRTAPVEASATRTQACLWSRELETKVRADPSGYHRRSQIPASQATWSLTIERCWSGGICRRITRGGSTSITTRWMRKITLSPGSGYRHDSSSGSPTRVRTRCIRLTPRPSCWKVAIFRESGDQVSTGRSLFTQPALLVA
jgi:hypothetical protein